ncbi:PD-(D/E)XK nuclease family transposase [Treponema putidum]|nr:putative transposase/invertase (TIGR01784 family) [Treponema putidum]
MLAENSEMMKKANAAISVMEMSPKEKWLYENRMKYEHDKASWKHVGYQEGIEAGIQESLDKGAYQKALETAKLMRMHNYPIAEICTMTGLTKEEVEAIN